MQLKHKIKFFTVLLTSTYTAFVFAQAQPQPNGSALGSTTEPGVEETAPSEITTMDPMDPSRDSRAGSDATQGGRRARAPASGTVTPQTVPNTIY